jgi:hypothetical protein
LRIKVHYQSDKDLKVRHRKTELSFANSVKENPDILYKSKNYEETFMNFCEELSFSHFLLVNTL